MTTDDFSPIQQSGELERARGILGRRRRRSVLPPVGHGSQRFFVDQDGGIAGGRNLSAGERFWADASSWVTVDMGAHQLTHVLAVRDRTGRAGYQVTLGVSAHVDPEHVDVAVRDRATTVKPLLEAALREALESTMESTEAPLDVRDAMVGRETAEVLEQMRMRVHDGMRRGLVGKAVPSAAEWLTAMVTSVDVRFDDDTRAHVGALIDQSRTGFLSELAVNQRITERQMWRQELAPRLPGADQRVLEAVLDNPTPQAVRETIEHMQGTERQHRQEMFDVVRLLLDGNHIRDVRDEGVWKALHTISRAIDPSNAKLASFEPGVLTGGEEQREAIEASAQTAEHSPPPADSSSKPDW